MKIYSHKTKKSEECKFIDNKNIKVYTCGPTVYDYPHIGNWYTFIRYDALVRTLRESGNDVTWVMNVTDVGHLVSDADSGEDKMEKGAKREGKTAWDVAKFYTDYFTSAMKKLNFSNLSEMPKATDYIEEQINLVKTLDDKGFTYRISDGVYFDTSKFAEYADFAQLDLTGQEEGARVSVNDEKRNPSDFALWKFSPKDEKRDMEWDSPWGIGFPGWHLECSAMIHAILGQPIDIHAGGIDHIPVHHTNEIAQSVAAYEMPLSNYWLHCNHIQVDGKKMSKSLGNFYTLEDLESKGFSALVFRALVLGGHYRSQSEFSWENLDATKNRLQNWVDRLSSALQINEEGDLNIKDARDQLLSPLLDDLNTPLALSLVDDHTSRLKGNDVESYSELLNNLFGLDLSIYLGKPSEEQLSKIEDRQKARDDKDWAQSDAIRDELKLSGINLKDTESGQIWSRIV